MIYITGDTHGAFQRLSTKNFPEQREMTRDDYLIICGDFGLIWDVGAESKEEKYWLKWFEEKPFTLLFIDGNHENFDKLYSYPVKEWHGGKVHVIREHVLHLMRGQVFTIDGKKFFTFGGARSHDITGGILDRDDPDFMKKKRELDRDCMMYRINHESWWEQELASEEEMEEGLENLKLNDHTVDYIITHCCSSGTQKALDSRLFNPDKVTDYLEAVKNSTAYKKWFFGHYHDDGDVNDKERLIYEQIIRLE